MTTQNSQEKGFRWKRVDQGVTINDISENGHVWFMTFEVQVSGEVYRTTVYAPHYLTPRFMTFDGLRYTRHNVVAKGLRELADMLDRYHPQPIKKGWNGTWRE